MQKNDSEFKIQEIVHDLMRSDISNLIDPSRTPPLPFRGSGPIELIILGQDPTVRKEKHKDEIKVTLLLDQDSRLPKYLKNICATLNLDYKKNLYATNILKNFFIDRPDQLEKKGYRGLIKNAFSFWRDFLVDELREFENVPVITLGEPVVNCLVNAPILIRNFWGYEGPGKYGSSFRSISPNENILGRNIFPFVHIHGLGHKMYRDGLEKYTSYMRSKFFS